MRGREPFKTRFRRGIEIQGFNQIQKTFASNYLTKKAFFSEKNWGLGAL